MKLIIRNGEKHIIAISKPFPNNNIVIEDVVLVNSKAFKTFSKLV